MWTKYSSTLGVIGVAVAWTLYSRCNSPPLIPPRRAVRVELIHAEIGRTAADITTIMRIVMKEVKSTMETRSGKVAAIVYMLLCITTLQCNAVASSITTYYLDDVIILNTAYMHIWPFSMPMHNEGEKLAYSDSRVTARRH